MKSDRFAQLEEWFQKALDTAPEDRAALIESLAQKDAALAKQLRAMLRADAQHGDQIGGVVTEAMGKEHPMPTHIGAFSVCKRLGSGGMGVVYLCQRSDQDFEQWVAIKMLRTGIDSEFARQRMRQERRLLAKLKHPNIAQLIDGGEDAQGTPYVVMEYVDGVSITQFAQQQQLSVRQRIGHFLSLCNAVQYAHRNMVVHRDIKAANVFIDDQQSVKLLDFGIAKLLQEPESESPLQTVASSMTPHYASPEQVRGEPVNQASDIYSLGILLYELLAGKLPYIIDTRQPSKVEQIVSESPVPALPGRYEDLDRIIAKATHKEPDRRYASAAAFADDLARWQSGLPIQARPDSSGYKFKLFLKRHPVGSAVTSFGAVLLLTFTTLITWQAGELAKQRDVATTEARIAGETTDFLIDLFAISDPRVTNPTDVRIADILAQARDELPRQLDSDPLTRARMMHVIGLAYANIGDQKNGVDMLQQALVLRMEHAGPDSAEVADSHNRLGNVLRRFGQLQEAEPLLLKALAWREQHGEITHDLADSYNNVGLLQNDLGRYEKAEHTLRKAIDYHRIAGGADTERVTAPLHNLSLSFQRQGRLREAREASLEALQIKRDNGQWSLSSLAVTLAVLANIERELDHLDAALAYSNESLQLREQVFGRDNLMIASGLTTHAKILADLDQMRDAESYFREAVSLHQASENSASLRAANARLELAMFYVGQSRWQLARPLAAQALADARQHLPENSPELLPYREAYQAVVDSEML